MRVRYSARSHVGMRREVNQDAYDAKEFGPATLLVVCDGMGGHAAGEVASQLGVETILATYSVEQPPEESLRQAFVLANQRVYGEGRGSMGTTGVAALFLNNTLYVANVGDSRAYMVRDGQISQISQDHSFVSDQVAAGLMTPEQARLSNVRNIITRALGHSAEVKVDLFTLGLLAGDTILLSSDGMHGLITDDEIAEVAAMMPPENAAQRLIDLANERGGTDNITVMIAQVDELDLSNGQLASATLPVAEAGTSAADRAERPLSRLGLTLAALTLVVLLGFGGYFWATSAKGTSPPLTANTAVAPAPTVLATTAAPTALATTAAPTALATTTVPTRPVPTPTQ